VDWYNRIIDYQPTVKYICVRKAFTKCSVKRYM